MKKYNLYEHTPMGDRETNLCLAIGETTVTGTADLDAAPGQRAEVEITEGAVCEKEISFLITLGGIPRRYRAIIDGDTLSGKVTFEGDSELAGIETPFDGKTYE